MGASLGTVGGNGPIAETTETLSEKTVVELLATESCAVPGGKNFSPSNLKSKNAPPTKERRETEESLPETRKTVLPHKVGPGPSQGGEEAAGQRAQKEVSETSKTLDLLSDLPQHVVALL